MTAGGSQRNQLPGILRGSLWGSVTPSFCPWRQETPTPQGIESSRPSSPLTSGPLGDPGATVDPHTHRPLPPPREGGSLTLWGSVDSLIPLWGGPVSPTMTLQKGFFLQKKKEKQVVIFFNKKPQTINKCKYIISEFTCKKIK